MERRKQHSDKTTRHGEHDIGKHVRGFTECGNEENENGKCATHESNRNSDNAADQKGKNYRYQNERYMKVT